MTCAYCQFVNIEDEHRCRRCGRRLVGTATAAPAHFAKEHVRIAVKVLGANALAATVVTNARAVETANQAEPALAKARTTPFQTGVRQTNKSQSARSIDSAATLDELPRTRAHAAQPSLFGAELQPKIIPFETIYRPAPTVISTSGDTAAAAALAQVEAPGAPGKRVIERPAPKAATRRKAAPAEAQATLDFLPPLKATSKTLKTSAEAVIFCDAMVAAPIHRATAAALDTSMILVAFGMAAVIFQALAQPSELGRAGLIAAGALLLMAALFYGLLFAIAGTVTPGMRWTNLRLINFDGFPPDGRSRALRFAGYWIGLASGGLGVIWAFLDEENLTWHDHISKTFPTLTESESIVVRHRNR